MARTKRSRTMLGDGNAAQRLNRIKLYAEEEWVDTERELEECREEYNRLSGKKDWLESKKSILEFLKETCSS